MGTSVVEPIVETKLVKVSKPQKPSIKRQRFAKAYVENNGNGTEAILQAGYQVKSRDVARTMASEVLADQNVQEMIRQGFKEAGLTKEKVFQLHSKGVIKAIEQGQPRMSDGFKGIDMLYKLFNWYPQNVKKVQHESIKYVFDGKDDKELMDLIKERLKHANELAERVV